MTPNSHSRFEAAHHARTKMTLLKEFRSVDECDEDRESVFRSSSILFLSQN